MAEATSVAGLTPEVGVAGTTSVVGPVPFLSPESLRVVCRARASGAFVCNSGVRALLACPRPRWSTTPRAAS
eukprot:11220928-Lingulodinium_polyedra.AAC.1